MEIKSYKKLFGSPLIFSSIKKNKQYFTDYLKQLGFVQFSDNPKQLWTNIYEQVFDNSRYEYIYKNEILKLFYADIMRKNKILLSEVELYSDNTIHNILDLLLISNGNMHAIEIKSDFDTFQRLDNQLPMYCELFQYVSVFVSDYKVKQVEHYIDNIGFDNVGIISLADYKVETIREPKSNEERINKNLILDNLKIRHPQLCNDTLSVEELYSYWAVILREDYKLDNKFVDAMPDALKFYAFSHNYLPPLKRQRLISHFTRHK